MTSAVDWTDEITAAQRAEHLAAVQERAEAPQPVGTGRAVRGGSWALDVPDNVPALWGDGDVVAWARGEACMLVGPQGVGKSTVAQQLVLARVGLIGAVLGMNVEVGRRVLYLACDRPAQVQRSFHRMVRAVDRELLDERLIVWKGPPLTDFARDPDALLEMAQGYRADTVVIDSLKDVALKLAEDEGGAGYNRARQKALANGVDLLELHHQTKRGAGGVGKPKTLADVYGSTWITSGAGSVLLLWGDAGDPTVELLHLKQPAEPVGPLDVVHDHQTGTSRVDDTRDPLVLLRSHDKLSAGQLARLLYIPDGTRQPKPNEVEKARRILERLHRTGHAYKPPSAAGDAVTYHYRPPRTGHPEAPPAHDPQGVTPGVTHPTDTKEVT